MVLINKGKRNVLILEGYMIHVSVLWSDPSDALVSRDVEDMSGMVVLIAIRLCLIAPSYGSLVPETR